MSEGIDLPPQASSSAFGSKGPAGDAGSAPTKPRKRFVGTSKPSSSRAPVRRIANQIPDDILHDPELNAAISGMSCALQQPHELLAPASGQSDRIALPSNYNFEIHKTIHHIRRDGFKTVALQMPEGLMVYGCAIADIVERWVPANAAA